MKKLKWVVPSLGILCAAVAGAKFFPVSRTPAHTPRRQAAELIARMRSNLDTRDFSFRVKIRRSYPDRELYAKTFQFYGVLGHPNSKVLFETVDGPPNQNLRCLLVWHGKNLARAKLRSQEFGDIEVHGQDPDMDKIAVGDLTYAEIMGITSIEPEDFDEVVQAPEGVRLRSRVLPGPDRDDWATTYFFYYADQQHALPARIDFISRRGVTKQFRVEATDMVDGRWIVRRAKIQDLFDHSETVFEIDNARFNYGIKDERFAE